MTCIPLHITEICESYLEHALSEEEKHTLSSWLRESNDNRYQLVVGLCSLPMFAISLLCNVDACGGIHIATKTIAPNRGSLAARTAVRGHL